MAADPQPLPFRLLLPNDASESERRVAYLEAALQAIIDLDQNVAWNRYQQKRIGEYGYEVRKIAKAALHPSTFTPEDSKSRS